MCCWTSSTNRLSVSFLWQAAANELHWYLKLSLFLKCKPIIINKSYSWEKKNHRNTYSDEEQSNNMLKISEVVMSAIYETLNLACSLLFKKGKALCQRFPVIQTNVPFSEKHILLHNDKGQVNALISHWNGFTATVRARWKGNLPNAIKISKLLRVSLQLSGDK